MQSTFENRIWLAWLVKVRILILTLLLAIELAIAQFTPGRFPIRLFVDTILFGLRLSAFYLVLLHFWDEHAAAVGTAGRLRFVAGQSAGRT